jgi:predicted nuclease of predicted toxin-antitoxin system
VRFLADMGVARRVLEWLRASGHDALHLRDEGLGRLTDSEILAKAVADNRIVITFDLDFGEIIAASGGRLTSVILFRLRDTRSERVIQRLSDVLADSSEALTHGAIVVVEDARHRVRRLPIG